MVTVSPKADNCKLNVVCDALILDEGSRSDTYPTMEVAIQVLDASTKPVFQRSAMTNCSI